MSLRLRPPQRWPLVRALLGASVAVLGLVGALAGQFAWDNAWMTAAGVAAIVAGGAVSLWEAVVVPSWSAARLSEIWTDFAQSCL